MDLAPKHSSLGTLLASMRQPAALAHLLGVLLLVFAFHDYFVVEEVYAFSDPGESAASQLEYFMFRPSEGSPVVIAALALWLTWRRRARIMALRPARGPWSLIVPALVIGAAVFGWARHTGAADLEIVSLISVLFALTAVFWGREGIRVLWPPIVVLLFALPLPAPWLLALLWKMQLATAQIAGWLLYQLGEPALVSGDQILRSGQVFMVIDGCSGIRFVEVLTLLTILLIDLFRRNGWHAALLLALAPIIAFALNGVRVLTLILNPSSDVITIHNTQGIVVLMGGVIVVYLCDMLIERLRGLDPTEPEPLPPEPIPPTFADRTALAVLLGVSLVAILLRVAVPAWEEPTRGGQTLAGSTRALYEPWEPERVRIDYNFFGSTRFRDQRTRRLHLGRGREVIAFVGASQLSQRGASPLSPMTSYPGSGWVIEERRVIEAPMAGERLEEIVAMRGRERRLVHHWTRGARSLVSEGLRNLFALDRSVFARAEPIVVARVETEMDGTTDEARRTARSTLESVEPQILDALRTHATRQGVRS